MAQNVQINGIIASRAELTVPYVGAWSATVMFEGDASLSLAPFGAAVIIGGSIYSGTVVRQGSVGGMAVALVVGGAGGWRRYSVPRAYRQAPGVPYATIFRDLAAEVGEQVGLAVGGVVQGGPHYVRPGGVASAVLTDLCAGSGVRAWWVDYGGETHLSDGRPETKIQDGYELLARNPSVPSVTVSPEDPGAWVPGAAFAPKALGETFVVSAVSLRFDGTGQSAPFTAEVLTL